MAAVPLPGMGERCLYDIMHPDAEQKIHMCEQLYAGGYAGVLVGVDWWTLGTAQRYHR